jgi:hypothetical protein
MEEVFQPIAMFVGAVLLAGAIIVVMSFRAQNRDEEKSHGKTRREEFLRSIPEVPAPHVLGILHGAVVFSLFWGIGTIAFSAYAALIAAREGGVHSGPLGALFFAATPLVIGGIAVFHMIVAVAYLQKRRWVPRLLPASLPMVLAGPFLIEDVHRHTVILGSVIVAAFILSIVLQRSRSLWYHCGWSAEDAERHGS